MTLADKVGLSTLSVHGGEPHPAKAGPVEPPIVLSSSFSFESAEQAAGAFRGENDARIYGRWGNPTVDDLEAKIAALEGAGAAAAVASGVAAISGTLLTLLGAGDHVVAPVALYGETARLLRERLPRLGITTTFVEDTSAAGYERAIQKETRLLYIETPANPTMAVTDIRSIVALARSRGLRTVADNTFATPYCQQPLALGVDLVIHSMTKFLGGHGDAIGGAVAGEEKLVAQVREQTVKGLGAALSPFGAFLIQRGVRTFALRMRQATGTALALARWLETHPAVERVHHPGLESSPAHAVAREQMRAFPAILSFEVRGGVAAGRKVLEGVKLITHAVSLGDTRTLITHPASTTASTMPPADRARAGIGDGLLRLAVGIEDQEDLQADLAQALGRIS
jgi:cystathionine beta-lyase/cystathionine gamma-synthase